MRDRLSHLQEIQSNGPELEQMEYAESVTSDTFSNVDLQEELPHEAIVYDNSPALTEVFSQSQDIHREVQLIRLEVKRLQEQNSRILQGTSTMSMIKRDSNAIGADIKSRAEKVLARLKTMDGTAHKLEGQTEENMAGRVKRKPKPNQESVGENGKLKRARTNEMKDAPTPTINAQQRDEIKELYSLDIPEDLYHFWDFCKELCPDNPRGALTDTLGLQLVGPFDVLAGAHKKLKTKPNLHLHWRYFYDPPEFQTIIRSDGNQLHFGYYRDTPDLLPSFVGENDAKKGCTITQMGDNVFAAVFLYLQRKKKEKGSLKPDLESLEAKLRDKAEVLGLSLEQKTKDMKQRDKKMVTKTFHGAGIVVPVDKNDVGYRELPETDAGLKKICKAIAEAKTDEERIKAFGPIQEMITFVQFANDECDYGMGYELGMDLFCYGSHYFHKIIKQLLPMAYNLLKRSLFGDIVEAHLSNRSQEPVDQLSN